MTPAEFRTIRASLGLSDTDVAQLLGHGNSPRTVRAWDSGMRRVPDDAAQMLRELEARVERAVGEALAMIRAMPEGATVALLRYRTPEDLARWRPALAETPSLHAAMIDRIRVQAERIGRPVRLVWMDPEDYEAWRAAEGRPDDAGTRAAWAGLRVEP